MRNRYEDMTSDEAFRRVQEMDDSVGPSTSYDPIFTPLFAAVFSAPIFGLSAAGIATAASFASAVAVTAASEGVHRK